MGEKEIFKYLLTSIVNASKIIIYILYSIFDKNKISNLLNLLLLRFFFSSLLSLFFLSAQYIIPNINQVLISMLLIFLLIFLMIGIRIGYKKIILDYCDNKPISIVKLFQYFYMLPRIILIYFCIFILCIPLMMYFINLYNISNNQLLDSPHTIVDIYNYLIIPLTSKDYLIMGTLISLLIFFLSNA